jgi:hypothetical protein
MRMEAAALTRNNEWFSARNYDAADPKRNFEFLTLYSLLFL